MCLPYNVYIFISCHKPVLQTLQLVQSAGTDVWWASDKMTFCETWSQEIHQKSIFLGVNNHQPSGKLT